MNLLFTSVIAFLIDRFRVFSQMKMFRVFIHIVLCFYVLYLYRWLAAAAAAGAIQSRNLRIAVCNNQKSRKIKITMIPNNYRQTPNHNCKFVCQTQTNRDTGADCRYQTLPIPMQKKKLKNKRHWGIHPPISSPPEMVHDTCRHSAPGACLWIDFPCDSSGRTNHSGKRDL